VRKSRTPAWLSLASRFALAFGLIGIALAVHWLDRDGLRQSSGEPITFADVLYSTMITVTTVGYGDIVPVTQQARLFDTFRGDTGETGRCSISRSTASCAAATLSG
jgi:voltage-gated potassium channel